MSDLSFIEKSHRYVNRKTVAPEIFIHASTEMFFVLDA